MIYGWDQDAMGQAEIDGHAMVPGDGRDLHAERHAEGGTGYAMFADREARRVLGDRTWHGTVARSMNRPGFGARPSSWDHPGASGDLGYAGGGVLGLSGAFASVDPRDEFGVHVPEESGGGDWGLGSPPLGGGWEGAVATIDGYAGGGLMGLSCRGQGGC